MDSNSVFSDCSVDILKPPLAILQSKAELLPHADTTLKPTRKFGGLNPAECYSNLDKKMADILQKHVEAREQDNSSRSEADAKDSGREPTAPFSEVVDLSRPSSAVLSLQQVQLEQEAAATATVVKNLPTVGAASFPVFNSLDKKLNDILQKNALQKGARVATLRSKAENVKSSKSTRRGSAVSKSSTKSKSSHRSKQLAQPAIPPEEASKSVAVSTRSSTSKSRRSTVSNASAKSKWSKGSRELTRPATPTEGTSSNSVAASVQSSTSKSRRSTVSKVSAKSESSNGSKQLPEPAIPTKEASHSVAVSVQSLQSTSRRSTGSKASTKSKSSNVSNQLAEAAMPTEEVSDSVDVSVQSSTSKSRRSTASKASAKSKLSKGPKELHLPLEESANLVAVVEDPSALASVSVQSLKSKSRLSAGSNASTKSKSSNVYQFPAVQTEEVSHSVAESSTSKAPRSTASAKSKLSKGPKELVKPLEESENSVVVEEDPSALASVSAQSLKSTSRRSTGSKASTKSKLSNGSKEPANELTISTEEASNSLVVVHARSGPALDCYVSVQPSKSESKQISRSSKESKDSLEADMVAGSEQSAAGLKRPPMPVEKHDSSPSPSISKQPSRIYKNLSALSAGSASTSVASSKQVTAATKSTASTKKSTSNAKNPDISSKKSQLSLTKSTARSNAPSLTVETGSVESRGVKAAREVVVDTTEAVLYPHDPEVLYPPHRVSPRGVAKVAFGDRSATRSSSSHTAGIAMENEDAAVSTGHRFGFANMAAALSPPRRAFSSFFGTFEENASSKAASDNSVGTEDQQIDGAIVQESAENSHLDTEANPAAGIESKPSDAVSLSTITEVDRTKENGSDNAAWTEDQQIDGGIVKELTKKLHLETVANPSAIELKPSDAVLLPKITVDDGRNENPATEVETNYSWCCSLGELFGFGRASGDAHTAVVAEVTDDYLADATGQTSAKEPAGVEGPAIDAEVLARDGCSADASGQVSAKEAPSERKESTKWHWAGSMPLSATKIRTRRATSFSSFMTKTKSPAQVTEASDDSVPMGSFLAPVQNEETASVSEAAGCNECEEKTGSFGTSTASTPVASFRHDPESQYPTAASASTTTTTSPTPPRVEYEIWSTSTEEDLVLVPVAEVPVVREEAQRNSNESAIEPVVETVEKLVDPVDVIPSVAKDKVRGKYLSWISNMGKSTSATTGTCDESLQSLPDATAVTKETELPMPPEGTTVDLGWNGPTVTMEDDCIEAVVEEKTDACSIVSRSTPADAAASTPESIGKKRPKYMPRFSSLRKPFLSLRKKSKSADTALKSLQQRAESGVTPAAVDEAGQKDLATTTDSSSVESSMAEQGNSEKEGLEPAPNQEFLESVAWSEFANYSDETSVARGEEAHDMMCCPVLELHQGEQDASVDEDREQSQVNDDKEPPHENHDIPEGGSQRTANSLESGGNLDGGASLYQRILSSVGEQSPTKTFQSFFGSGLEESTAEAALVPEEKHSAAAQSPPWKIWAKPAASSTLDEQNSVIEIFNTPETKQNEAPQGFPKKKKPKRLLLFGKNGFRRQEKKCIAAAPAAEDPKEAQAEAGALWCFSDGICAPTRCEEDNPETSSPQEKTSSQRNPPESAKSQESATPEDAFVCAADTRDADLDRGMCSCQEMLSSDALSPARAFQRYFACEVEEAKPEAAVPKEKPSLLAARRSRMRKRLANRKKNKQQPQKTKKRSTTAPALPIVDELRVAHVEEPPPPAVVVAQSPPHHHKKTKKTSQRAPEKKQNGVAQSLAHHQKKKKTSKKDRGVLVPKKIRIGRSGRQAS